MFGESTIAHFTCEDFDSQKTLNLFHVLLFNTRIFLGNAGSVV